MPNRVAENRTNLSLGVDRWHDGTRTLPRPAGRCHARGRHGSGRGSGAVRTIPGCMARHRGPVSLLVVGAGDRGNVYADYARRHPAAARVVAIAEIDPTRRAAFAARHRLPADRSFGDWSEALNAGRLADAVI